MAAALLRTQPLSFGNKPPLILVVDDDRAYLRIRKAMLEREGYHVIGASTAGEAIQVLRENAVCLTISDHMLTGTNGTRLAVRLKEIKPGVPIIIYSGTRPDSLKSVDAFMEKGESPAKFLSLVADILERYFA